MKNDEAVQITAHYRELELSVRDRHLRWLRTIYAVAGDATHVWDGKKLVTLDSLDLKRPMWVNHNMLAPMLSTKLAAAIQNEPGSRVIPLATGQAAEALRRSAESFLRWQYHTRGLSEAIQEACTWAMVTNIGWLGAIWDELAGKPVQRPKLGADGKPVMRRTRKDVEGATFQKDDAAGRTRTRQVREEREEPVLEWVYPGDLTYVAGCPFDIFPFRAQTWRTCRGLYDRQFWTLEELKDAFGGDEVKGLEPNVTSEDFVRVDPYFDATRGDRREKYVLVLRRWEEWSKGHEEGRLRIIAGDRVLHDGTLPGGLLPYHPFNDQPVSWSMFGEAPLGQAVEPQHALNGVESDIRTDHRYHAHARMVVWDQSLVGDKGNDLPSDPDDVIVVKQGMKAPQPLEQPQLPSWVQALAEHYKGVIQTVGQVHSITMGDSSGAYSGRQVMAHESADSRKWMPFLKGLSKSIGHVQELGLVLQRDHGEDEVLFEVYGANGPTGDVDIFRKGHLDLGFKVYLDPTELMPYNGDLLRQQINEAWQIGAIPDLVTYWRLQRQGDLSRLIGTGEPSRRRAWAEHDLLDAGQEVPVLEHEDHPVHLDEHLEVMRSNEWYLKDPEVQKMWLVHIQKTMAMMQPQNQPNPVLAGNAPMPQLPVDMPMQGAGGQNMSPVMNGAMSQGPLPGTSTHQETTAGAGGGNP